MKPRPFVAPLLTETLIDDLTLLLDFELSASLVTIELSGEDPGRRIKRIIATVKNKEVHMEPLIACRSLMAAFRCDTMLMPMSPDRYDFWEEIIFRDQSYLDAGLAHAMEHGAPEDVVTHLEKTIRSIRAAVARLKETWTDAEKIERDQLNSRLSEHVNAKEDRVKDDQSFNVFTNFTGLKN